MAAEPSPPVSQVAPGGSEQPAGRRFERYVTRLPDGRRLTLYSRLVQVPTSREDG
ncbi:MAG TPA: hypothetical protein VHX15_08705 [Frankiaceae bacterium]|nr:hypothetical protein [Frankiaceae bacterium]